MGVSTGPAGVYRKYLALVLEGLAVVVILGAMASPAWIVIPTSCGYLTNIKDVVENGDTAQVTVDAMILEQGLFWICGPNATTETFSLGTDDDVSTYEVTGFERVCASGTQEVYETFVVSPRADKDNIPTVSWAGGGDAGRNGALSMMVFGVMAAIASIVLRVLHFLKACNSCTRFIQPGSLVALTSGFGAACAIGATYLIDASNEIRGVSPATYLLSLFSVLNSADAVNQPELEINSIQYGLGYNAAIVAAILLGVAAIDSVWGLSTPIEAAGGGNRRANATTFDEDEEETSGPRKASPQRAVVNNPVNDVKL